MSQGMVELLDAILDRVNSISWTPVSFKLQRSYYPLAKLSSLAEEDAVKAFLIPGQETPIERMDRSGTRGESLYSFELGIFRKYTIEDENDEIDQFMKLADNVRQFLMGQIFETLNNKPSVIGPRFDPSYDQGLVNKNRTFLSIIKFEVKWLQDV